MVDGFGFAPAPRASLLCLLALLLGLWAPPAYAQERFPEVTGRALSGADVTLPSGFDGAPSLVVVAWKRRQQEDVDAWQALATDLGVAPLRFFQVSSMGSLAGFLRRLIENAMRDSVSDPARVVLVYEDKPTLDAGLGGESDAVRALLVAPGGAVLWSAAGRPTEEHRAALAGQL